MADLAFTARSVLLGVDSATIWDSSVLYLVDVVGVLLLCVRLTTYELHSVSLTAELVQPRARPLTNFCSCRHAQSVAEFGQESPLRRKSSANVSISSRSSRQGHSETKIAISSSSSDGDGDGSLLSPMAGGSLARETPSVLLHGGPSCSSSLLSQSRQGAGATAVPGASPLEVRPSLATRRVLRTLRMYVTRLRVTKDNESRAEE